MQIITLSLFIFFLINRVNLDQTIIMSYFSELKPAPRVYLGEKVNNFYLYLSLQEQYTWISIPSSKAYNISKENTVNQVELQRNGQKLNALTYSASLYFDSNEPAIDNYYFYIFNLQEKKNKGKIFGPGGIGLAHKFRDEKFSIVHSLYNLKKIERKIFSIADFDKHITIGMIYFGKLPTNAENKKYQGKCSVTKNSINWGCKLKRVEIGEFSYNAKRDNMLFETSFENIIVPEKFLDFVNETVLKTHKHGCEYTNNLKGTKFIRCHMDELEALPIYRFIFDGVEFDIPMGRLFVDGLETSDSALLSNKDLTGDPDLWVFGGRFLSNFITVFNYDDNEISFFTNKYVIKVPNLSNIDEFVLILFKGLILFICINLFFLIYIKKQLSNYYLNRKYSEKLSI